MSQACFLKQFDFVFSLEKQSKTNYGKNLRKYHFAKKTQKGRKKNREKLFTLKQSTVNQFDEFFHKKIKI